MQTPRLDSESDEKVARALQFYSRARLQSHTGQLPRHHATLIAWRLRLLLWNRLRRAIDCTVALLLLVLASPVLLLTAIAIKLESPGPVIFRQTRVGKWGKAFTLYKFRSMSVDAEQRKRELLAHNEADGPVFKIRRDPRVTRVGAFIRKFSIDELPQFVNVLKGDMNLVGPRPPVPDEVNNYRLEHLRRLEVTPGITGLAQIMGRSDLDFDTWVEFDRQYITRQNLRTDLEILLKTVPTVLLGRGAY